MPWIITPEDLSMREDLRHLDICSVDPPGCTDIDDALHCRPIENGLLEVGVHIADVTSFLRPENAMDLEASSRGTTVYLVDQRIDMLPVLLSSNLCSLRGNEDRFAFSVIWKILPETAEIVDVRYCKSIIRSRQSFTYAQAQLQIDDPSLRDPVTIGLRALNSLAKKLKSKRSSNGALTLASLETRFNIDSETHDPISVQEKKPLETHSMVEEFMLLANISVATRIQNEYPDCAVLRRHPVPPASNYKPVLSAAATRGFALKVDSGKALAQSLDQANIKDNPFFNRMLRVLTTRCMTQALYFASGTLEQKEYFHFGLATPIYTHFTSPIRRYADVLVHRLLAAAIRADEPHSQMMDKRKIQEICNNLNYRHRNAQLAGRASVLMNTHRFFRGKVEELEGYVLMVRQNAIQVLIPKYGLDSAIPLPRAGPFTFDPSECTISAPQFGVTLKMFDKIVVQLSLDSSDVQHEKLKLVLVEPAVPGFTAEPVFDAPPENMETPYIKKPKL